MAVISKHSGNCSLDTTHEWYLPMVKRGGKIMLTAESDALIVKGIIALLIRVLNGHTPQEILDADLYFIERIGLRDHLSPTRSNGLLAMVKQIRMYEIGRASCRERV